MLKIKAQQTLQKVMQNKNVLAVQDAAMLVCSVDAAIRQNLNNVSHWTYNDDNVFVITGPTLAITDDVQVDDLYAAWDVIVKTYAAKQLA
jgi:hypothetical protein